MSVNQRCEAARQGSSRSDARLAHVGPFYIAQSQDGRFHPVFRDEDLGSYHSPASAADDLAGGHTFSVPGGYDTSDLGIPYDIGEWEAYTDE
jgi:hypothetical protein